MLDQETLTALQENKAIEAAQKALAFANKDANDLAALPSDYKLHDLEQFMPNRRRARGTMTTSVLTSFADYSKAHAENGASVFINTDSLRAVTVLNLGMPESPGHSDNRVALELEKTAAYKALTGIATGAGRSQKDVAEFMEDWSGNVKCFDETGEIKTSKAIAAVRKITIESMRKMESEEQSLSASKSAFESIQASSKEPLPTIIYFQCEPYAGLESRLFVLRLGVLTGESTPKVNLRIVKAEQHQEEMAQELAAKITMLLAGEQIPVLLGGYSKTA
jgi:uncharacterized protein YfdQ (DUF2303 family)